MHIVLTDLLTCPACGAGHGLVARADRISERYIEQGALGCPACLRQYPIRDGVAYLLDEGTPGTGEAESVEEDPNPAEAEVVRIAALLGIDRVNGFVLLTGDAGRYASQVAMLGETAEVVVADSFDAPAPAGTISRLVIGEKWPFHPGKLHGIWLAGEFADSHLEVAVAALRPTARLVLEPSPDNAQGRLGDTVRVIARQGDTVVCERTA